MYVQHEEVYYLFDEQDNEIGVQAIFDDSGIDVTQEANVFDDGEPFIIAKFEVEGRIEERVVRFNLYGK